MSMKRVTFWLDERTLQQLDVIKEQTGVLKSQQFRRALRAWVESCRAPLEVHVIPKGSIDMEKLRAFVAQGGTQKETFWQFCERTTKEVDAMPAWVKGESRVR
jgi:hypothetical protein